MNKPVHESLNERTRLVLPVCVIFILCFSQIEFMYIMFFYTFPQLFHYHIFDHIHLHLVKQHVLTKYCLLNIGMAVVTLWDKYEAGYFLCFVLVCTFFRLSLVHIVASLYMSLGGGHTNLFVFFLYSNWLGYICCECCIQHTYICCYKSISCCQREVFVVVILFSQCYMSLGSVVDMCIKLFTKYL